VTGFDSTGLETVSVTLPEGWSGLASNRVVLGGSGFSGAAFTFDEDTVTITGATVTDWASGIITLNDLIPPGAEGIPYWGEARFLVKTATAGGTLTEISKMPEGHFVIPIARIREVDERGIPTSIGRAIAVSGVATVASGEFSQDRFSTYLQDDGAGVAIDHPHLHLFWGAAAGQRYAAVGSVSQYQGLTQISLQAPADFVHLGQGLIPEPVELTVAQFLANAERYEGMLLRIARVTKTEGSAAWPVSNQFNINMTVSDGGPQSLMLHINRFTDIVYMPEPVWPLDLVGLAGQFKTGGAPFLSGYQIIPRSIADFLPPSDPPLLVGFEGWRARHFAPGDSAGSALADPDGDGVPNLLEYAFGGNPHGSSRQRLPVVQSEGGRLRLSFMRSRDAGDLIYVVQASEDLLDWTAIWSSESFPHDGTEEFLEERVEDSREISQAGRRFLRLVVTQH
jgi:hypothetical protein